MLAVWFAFESPSTSIILMPHGGIAGGSFTSSLECLPEKLMGRRDFRFDHIMDPPTTRYPLALKDTPMKPRLQHNNLLFFMFSSAARRFAVQPDSCNALFP